MSKKLCGGCRTPTFIQGDPQVIHIQEEGWVVGGLEVVCKKHDAMWFTPLVVQFIDELKAI